MRIFTASLVCLAMLATAARADAQESLNDVLSFLLINRSIPTGDFSRDEQAAARTRDAIAGLLGSELGTLPINSPVSGFTYRLDPALGSNVRATSSFGPFFTERSLTGGRGHGSFGVVYTQADFTTIDGRNLEDGTLVATASRFKGDLTPFDAESMRLLMRTRMVTFLGQFGVTDRLDVSAALPFVTMQLSGDRVDVYRGNTFVQANAVASASGLGDAVVRAKYNVVRWGGSGLAAGAEIRFPTGDQENLLGTGEFVVTPRVIGSFERGALGVHGSFGYGMGAPAQEIQYAGAIAVAATSRVTLIGEYIGRRLSEGGHLTEVVEPHPTLAGVETIRLTAAQEPSTRGLVAAGVRWNVGAKWLLSVSVMRAVTTAGLNARWVPAFTFDYSLGG
jgi:Putative MetA-pathway of phenol degradation